MVKQHSTQYQDTITLSSLNYRYSVVPPKAFDGLFATHHTVRSTKPVKLGASAWVRLSDSDKYHRYLAASPDGAIMVYTGDTGLVRRIIPAGNIVLTEHTEGGGYLAHIPDRIPQSFQLEEEEELEQL